jgi:MFS family permease
MPVTGALITRFGSRPCSVWATAAFCAALALIPLASNAATLTALLVLYGATAGAMDVSMNSQGVTVERFYRRSILSGFHALFSLGGMIGAAAGGQLAAVGVSTTAHFGAAALLCALGTFGIAGLLIGPDREIRVDSGPMFAMPRGPVLGLGVVAFCILLGEGAIADWTAIYLRDALRAGPAAAASGYAVFSAAMAAGRFAGDWVTDRIGSVRVTRYGSLVATAGLVVALVSERMDVILGGLLATGFGYAAIVPNLFGAAGRIPGVPSGAGIAAVTTMGFTGFLVGPPLIGWLAEWTNLRSALFVLVFLTLAGSLLAGVLRAARPAHDGETEREIWEIHG